MSTRETSRRAADQELEFLDHAGSLPERFRRRQSGKARGSPEVFETQIGRPVRTDRDRRVFRTRGAAAFPGKRLGGVIALPHHRESSGAAALLRSSYADDGPGVPSQRSIFRSGMILAIPRRSDFDELFRRFDFSLPPFRPEVGPLKFLSSRRASAPTTAGRRSERRGAPRRETPRGLAVPFSVCTYGNCGLYGSSARPTAIHPSPRTSTVSTETAARGTDYAPSREALRAFPEFPSSAPADPSGGK